MYSLITIILFFVYLWGLGFSATYFVKKAEDFWERHLMNLGIGLGVFAILSIILNFLHIPLDWKIFLILSLIIPIYDLIQRIKKKELSLPASFNFSNFKLTKSNLALLGVIFIVLISFYIYTKGAFSYPYLEDDDPWGHSEGMKYVALEKTAYDPVFTQFYPDKQDQVLSYIDPYPPAYDILIGILHQTSPDLNWTMKFFNALIISLGFLFFYLWAKLFTGNRNHALLATFILASLPSYLSHFIWAHALSLTLFFPTLYAFHQIQSDKRWTIPAVLLVAGIWVSQNMEQPVKLTTLLLIYVIVFSIAHKKWYKYETLAIIGGFFLSLVWWLSVGLKHSFPVMLKNYGVVSSSASVSAVGNNLTLTAAGSAAAKQPFLIKILTSLTNPGGSASRAYTFSDFFYAKGENMINNPIGIGVVVSILVLVGLVYVLWRYRSELFTPEKAWLGLTLFWLVYGFWGVNGMTFPLSIARGAFRTWMVLAIPISLLAVEGFYFLTKLSKQKVFCWGIGILLLIGIIFTSAVPKYELNTATWPTSGAFANIPEAFEYGAWFKTIPPDSKVFLYSVKQKIVIGFGGNSCSWCEDELIFKENILDQSIPELYTFLKSKQYEYLIINPTIDYQKFKGKYGEEETKIKLSQRYKEIESSGLFQMVYQKGFIVLKIK
ncbi:MAG TPA: hypothetical protein VJA23_02610 [Candidatus Nanoarchaeia archaeon]|nr:hypothetical protein [Candidatus Nanoarchaeia archaeon]